MIWLHDLNRKIKDDCEKIKIKYGNEEPKNVTVKYSNPEGEEHEEGFFEDLPRILFEIYDIQPDLKRKATWQGVKMKVDENEDIVKVKDMPLPFWIYYKITIMAEYQSDVIDLYTGIMEKFPYWCYLKIMKEDESEEEIENVVFMELLKHSKPDRWYQEVSRSEEAKRRIFSPFLQYRVTAELDIGELETYNKVKDIIITENSE